jgi:hypothetical protein
MYLTADVFPAELGRMNSLGKIVLKSTVLVAAAISIGVAVATTITALSPQGLYACDFRLISAATCDLPMAAHTIRVPISPDEAEHALRVAWRDRIIACEREKTAKRRMGEPVLPRKCWDEGLTFLAR